MTTINIQRMGSAQIDAVPMKKFLEASRRVDSANGSVVIDGTQYDISTVTFSGGSFENIQGTKYIYVSKEGSDTEGKAGSPVNPYKTITAAYAKAKTLAPAANATVIISVCPGNYAENLNMDTAFINVIAQITNPSITNIGNAPSALTLMRPVRITGNVTITAANHILSGIDITGNLNLDINPGLINDVIVTGNIISVGNVYNGHLMTDVHTIAAGQFLNSSGDVNGNYISCSSDGPGFAGNTGIASGIFIDCKSASGSFGLVASGIFTDCIVTDNGFGSGANSQATGTFTRCISQGGASFGFGANAQVSGIFENCKSGTNSFGDSNSLGSLTSGTFINCNASLNSFGETASGKFFNCTADSSSFGRLTASGEFFDCEASTNSFGDSASIGSFAIGTFKNCRAGSNSFGQSASGKFTDCTAGQFSFGRVDITIGAILINCVAGDNSFGDSIVGGTFANGKFTNCTGGINCFGNIAGGIFIDCTGGNFCFGTGTASGNFINCTAGTNSFGNSASAGSNASGTFVNCTANNNSFGDIASGIFSESKALLNSFGQTTFSGRAENCIGGNNSFAFLGGGTISGFILNCQTDNSDAIATVSGTIDNLTVTNMVRGLNPVTITGVIRNTRIKASGPGQQPFIVGANSIIYNCVFVSNAALNAAAPVTPSKIYNTALNIAVGANVVNGITTLALLPQVDAALDF